MIKKQRNPSERTTAFIVEYSPLFQLLLNHRHCLARMETPLIMFLWTIYVFSVMFFLCFRVRLLIDALWSPAGKGLTSWFSFVMSNCEVITFPLVSCVRCVAWLYRFLIFALFLTFPKSCNASPERKIKSNQNNMMIQRKEYLTHSQPELKGKIHTFFEMHLL